MEGYDGGHDNTPPELRELRDQKARIVSERERKRSEALQKIEAENLRREIRELGEEPCK